MCRFRELPSVHLLATRIATAGAQDYRVSTSRVADGHTTHGERFAAGRLPALLRAVLVGADASTSAHVAWSSRTSAAFGEYLGRNRCGRVTG
jgi:hypothetical protein